MFPYLRTKKQFLKDCRTLSYKIEKRGNDEYVLIKNNEQEVRQRPFPCEECGQSHCSDFGGPCRVDDNTIYVSTVVGWLIHNLNLTNWGADNNNSPLVRSEIIENHPTNAFVSFSSIKSWCRSITKYMYDVLYDYRIPNSIMVGLEYYIDYSGNDSRTRVDMILAGYGLQDNSKRKRIAIIELKQWNRINIHQNNNRIMWTRTEESAIDQVRAYVNKITEAISGSQEQGNDPIQFIPYVYMHDCDTIDRADGIRCWFSRDGHIMYDKSPREANDRIPVFLKDSAANFSGYLANDFNGSQRKSKKDYKGIKESV